jgi:hypothetical protein
MDARGVEKEGIQKKKRENGGHQEGQKKKEGQGWVV